MKRLFSLAVIAVFFAGSASAFDYDRSLSEVNKSEIMEEFNSRTDEIPAMLFVPIRDRTVNVDIGGGEYGVEMDGEEIDEISNTHYSSADVLIEISEGTADRIRNSSDPVSAVRQARGDDIKIEYLGGDGSDSSSGAEEERSESSSSNDKESRGSGPVKAVSEAVDGFVGRVQVAAANLFLG